jgi:hypothetical protein
MTAMARWTDDEVVSDVLGVVLDAVEAVLRAAPDVETRLDTLHQLGDTEQMLVAISIATLDQLGDGLEYLGTTTGGDLAAALLDRAVQFDVAPRSTVHAAACRLEVVVRHDRWQLTGELRRSRAAGSDAGLVAGAIALLAAIVELSARRRGLAPALMAECLCLAASSLQPT